MQDLQRVRSSCHTHGQGQGYTTTVVRYHLCDGPWAIVPLVPMDDEGSNSEQGQEVKVILAWLQRFTRKLPLKALLAPHTYYCLGHPCLVNLLIFRSDARRTRLNLPETERGVSLVAEIFVRTSSLLRGTFSSMVGWQWQMFFLKLPTHTDGHLGTTETGSWVSRKPMIESQATQALDCTPVDRYKVFSKPGNQQRRQNLSVIGAWRPDFESSRLPRVAVCQLASVSFDVQMYFA
jgi:hypothetical protein